jgi:hypothetical protein
MPLGLYRNNLDFEILETGNPSTLVFVDSSQYIEPPDKPLLEVFIPGYSKYLLVNIIPNQVNTFNSSTLRLSESLSISHLTILPDGVWNFKYKICPYAYVFIEKSTMRTTLINKKLDRAYNEIDLERCTDKTSTFILDQLTRVQILIRGSKAVVEKDQKRASEYYNLADRLLDQVLDKFCKNCSQWGAQLAGNRE